MAIVDAKTGRRIEELLKEDFADEVWPNFILGVFSNGLGNLLVFLSEDCPKEARANLPTNWSKRNNKELIFIFEPADIIFPT